MIKTTLILLVWNALEYTKLTIQSLLKSKEEFDLIIFDNGSKEEVKNYLRSLDDKRIKKIIYSKTNLGVWKGRINALQDVNTKYVCFVDNDVIVPNIWLSRMEAVLDRNPTVGAVGPWKISKHLKHPYNNYNLKDYWHICERKGGSCSNTLKMFLFGNSLSKFSIDLVKCNRRSAGYISAPTRSISGCMLLTRLQLFRNKDILDRNYGRFKYGFEDMDYSWSLLRNKHRLYKCNKVYVHHFEHSSVDDNSLPISGSENSQALSYFAHKWEQTIIRWVKDHKESAKNDEFILYLRKNLSSENMSKELLFALNDEK